jgi:hypothetical protein
LQHLNLTGDLAGLHAVFARRRVEPVSSAFSNMSMELNSLAWAIAVIVRGVLS